MWTLGQLEKTLTHPFLVEEGAPSGDPIVVVGAEEVHTKHALLVWKVLYVVWDEAWVQHLARPPSAVTFIVFLKSNTA